jgi:uncharacterized UBP type Zn finger protein
MSKLDEEHPSWESLRRRVAAATEGSPGIPNTGNQCYVSSLLQLFFALPVLDNFNTKVGHTQDLLRLVTHESIVVRRALAQMVKARLPELGMEQGAQQDASELLQKMIQIEAPAAASERNLLDVLRLVSFEQIIDCHCRIEHEPKPDPKYIMNLPDKSCTCARSISCKCPVSVKGALDAMNTTEDVTNFHCDRNDKEGFAKRKYSLDSTVSPDLVFLAQGRVNKNCDCADKAKCSHKVTPSLTFIFPVAVPSLEIHLRYAHVHR